MLKRMLIALFALAVVLGGIFGWKYYQERQRQAQAVGPPPPAVSSATVQETQWRRHLEAVGSFVAVHGVRVTSEVAGIVREIPFRSGEQVAEGDLLLQLDDSVDQAELEGLLAERHLAQLQFERSQRLQNRGTVPQADLDEASARLEDARARVAAQRALIEKKAIRAPFAGQLGIRLVDLGEYLEPGSDIVELQSLDPIYLDFSLPEQHFAQVARRQTVVARVRAYPDRSFRGAITAKNAGISPATRSFRVRAELDNPDRLLRPGMFADVQVLREDEERVRTLPRTAIAFNPYGDSVFVIRRSDAGEPVVERRQVRTGDVRGEQIEIVAGLKAGERVVATGQMKLRNGQRVRIEDSVELKPEMAERP